MTGRQRQRGAALLTAMVIVVLVATLGASMLWQQWRSVQVEAAERARTQSAWILAGALDWARLILREDFKSDIATRQPPTDNLNEPWSVPLAEARLSSFLANGDANAEDAPDAFLSGAITDAQARINLASLLNGGTASKDDLAILERVCTAAGVDTGVAARLLNGLRGATALRQPAAAAAPNAPPSAPQSTSAAQLGEAIDPAQASLYPRSASQLTWLGIAPETARALEPYLTIIESGPNQVNINTASREVIAAVAGIDPAAADQMIRTRQRTPYGSVPTTLPNSGRFSVTSSYFEVRGRLRLGDVVLEQRSLVNRLGTNVKVLSRERVAERDART